MLSFKQTKLPSTESGKHILIVEADARECSALMSYFSLKYKGENEKKKSIFNEYFSCSAWAIKSRTDKCC